jgi:hypothetical protein
VADDDAEEELSALRRLLRPGDEISFFTDVDASPEAGVAFEQFIDESATRLRASAQHAAAIGILLAPPDLFDRAGLTRAGDDDAGHLGLRSPSSGRAPRRR